MYCNVLGLQQRELEESGDQHPGPGPRPGAGPHRVLRDLRHPHIPRHQQQPAADLPLRGQVRPRSPLLLEGHPRQGDLTIVNRFPRLTLSIKCICKIFFVKYPTN